MVLSINYGIQQFIQDLVSKIFYVKLLAVELLRINAFNAL